MNRARTALVACCFLAAGLVIGGSSAAADPADPGHPDPTGPAASMVIVRNVSGNLGTGYRCVLTTAGGVDCDFDHPVRVPARRPR